MWKQELGNLLYYNKATDAYNKGNYVKTSKYLDKYMISRNQKKISFKDDPFRGAEFYWIKGRIGEVFLKDYPMAIEAYRNSIELTKKHYHEHGYGEEFGIIMRLKSEGGLKRIEHKIMTHENKSRFCENVKKPIFETYYDDANDENVFRITFCIPREVMMIYCIESEIFRVFGIPGHLEYDGGNVDYKKKTKYDYYFSQLKTKKSFEELAEIFKRQFSVFISFYTP